MRKKKKNFDLNHEDTYIDDVYNICEYDISVYSKTFLSYFSYMISLCITYIYIANANIRYDSHVEIGISIEEKLSGI